MKRARRWLLGVVASFLIVGALPAIAEEQAASSAPPVHSVPAHTLLISEVQTATPTSASQEFIELFNNGTTDIDLAGWHVQYFSSSTTDFTKSPTRNIALADVLARHDYYLIVSTGYLPDQAQATYSAGLSASAGYLRVVDADSQVQDLIGWGASAVLAEGGHPIIPGSDTSSAHSLKRKVNEDGVLQDTNDNLADFLESATPSPQPRMETVQLTYPDPADSDTTNPELPEDSPTTSTDEVPAETPGDTPEDESDNTVPVEITELLPNPASPQTDSSDEFVELYNPSDSLVDLAGLKLQTGTTFSHSVLLDDISIPAGGYYVLYSKDSSLTLSNSGGNARIVDKDGALVADSAAYDTAPDGQSWVLYEGAWQWSSTPTPLHANIVTSVAAATKSAAKTSAAKKTTAKKATTSTKASAKKVSSSTSSSSSGAASGGGDVSEEQPPATIHPMVLAGVGVLAVGYEAYEYRDDIRNRFSQRRANRKLRRAHGALA